VKKELKGIGFDLFNTLIFAEPNALKTALGRLTSSLLESGIQIDPEQFRQYHRESAIYFIRKADESGIETHNRFWISGALTRLGITLSPDDPIIQRGVDAYFSAFYDHCHLIPGTVEMLKILSTGYRIGLVSNFTHAPAARKLLEFLRIADFLHTIIISGEVGYRKPNPRIFDIFCDSIKLNPAQILYVGDDPLHDIEGAMKAGIQPVWMTYVMDEGLPVVPGHVRYSNDHLDQEVPRISSWDQFMKIMKIKHNT